MDIQAYIESGILEEYCLGNLSNKEEADLMQMAILYPEIKAELSAVELAFENLSAETATKPGDHIKQNILAILGFDEELNINELPVLKHSANPHPWLSAFGYLIPENPTENFLMHIIRQDDIVQQMLITANTDVPDEEHGEFYEGLYILKGRCECTVGEDFFSLGPGDFIEIPLNTKHDIKLVTPYVTAVLQYRFV